MKRLFAFAILVAALLSLGARAGALPRPLTGQQGNTTSDENDDSAAKKGQPTGSKFTPAERKTMLSLHNQARSAVGVAPLTWSPELAAYAQKWADHLATTNGTAQHRPFSGEWKELYGEGVYGGKASTAGVDEAFTMWERSKRFYHGEPVSASDLRAANYTQLVWSTTTQFGCGKATAKDGTVIIICNYDPQGNVVGQKPY